MRSKTCRSMVELRGLHAPLAAFLHIIGGAARRQSRYRPRGVTGEQGGRLCSRIPAAGPTLPKLAIRLRSSEAWRDPSLNCVRTWPLMISPAGHTLWSNPSARCREWLARESRFANLRDGRPKLDSSNPIGGGLPPIRSASRSVIREKRLHRPHHACRRHAAIEDVELDDRIHNAPPG